MNEARESIWGYEIRGGGDGSGRGASGPEIASGAIAGGSTEVITRQSHLPQNCKSFIRHNDPRAITSRATYGQGFVIAQTDSKAAILHRAKQSTPISNPNDPGYRLAIIQLAKEITGWLETTII